jgi:hypothetical protein
MIEDTSVARLSRLQNVSTTGVDSRGREVFVASEKDVAAVYMLMRMYLPKIEVLNGQYEIPGVVEVK